jgi:hypothetical protein
MHTQPDEFRTHAEDCRKLAACALGAGKFQYEESARHWLKLAERVERLKWSRLSEQFFRLDKWRLCRG